MPRVYLIKEGKFYEVQDMNEKMSNSPTRWQRGVERGGRIVRFALTLLLDLLGVIVLFFGAYHIWSSSINPAFDALYFSQRTFGVSLVILSLFILWRERKRK